MEITENVLQHEIADLNDNQITSLLQLVVNNIHIENKTNSSVLYCLGLTDTKPNSLVKRIGGSVPDFDIDFQKDKRDQVIQYVRNKYGLDKVAQIGTFGTFKAKKSIKDVARTLGYSIPMANALCKLYPKPIHGKEVSMKEAFSTNIKLKTIRESATDEGEVLRWAEKVEGRVASYGIHAAGIVIANEPLTNYVPLAKGKNNEVVTQWDMGNVEEVGLIKFDFLGLKTLTVISNALTFIRDTTGKTIDIEAIPENDIEVFNNLRRGDNIGIFQIEGSTGIRDLTVKVRPTSILDLAAIGAMYRPGPLGSEQMQAYLDWRAGIGTPRYHHKDLEPILRETGAWLVYQEQVLRIARDLAGFTLAEADILRRAVGKKKAKEMLEQKSKFFDGLKKNGYTEDLGETLWNEINAFSDYGFNKSHAVAYAIITYQTAWLKTNYPVQFMAAALTCDSGNQDQMIVYVQECKRMGIKVLPPDVNESGLIFTPVGNTIRFGLSAIKNVGEAATHILEVREKDGEFKDFFDFCERVDLGIVNKKKLESLVLSGSFDFTHQTRATLLQAVDIILDFKAEKKRYESKLETFNKKNLAVEERLREIEAGKTNPKGKALKPLANKDAPIPPPRPRYIECPEMNLMDILANEKDLTGSFISGHPLDNVIRKSKFSISDIKTSEESPDFVELIAILSKIELKETKQKKRMAFLKLEDLTGTVDATIFPGNYEKHLDTMLKNVPFLITAKVDYIESETEEGEIVSIPSLIIQKIDFVATSIQKTEEPTVEVKLSFASVKKLIQAVNKTGNGEEKLRVKFNTSSSISLLSTSLIGINNERTFRTNFNK